MTDTLYYTTHTSSIGNLLLVAGARGMRYMTLLGSDTDMRALLNAKFSTSPKPTLMELNGFFATATTAINAYLAGNGAPLTLPYDLAEGTHLQRAVWIALTKIPFGETVSYSALAEYVGFPRAVRAVASACGANPLPLIIPCHRVIAKDGSLGGFSLGGVEVKEHLLALESTRAGVSAAA